MGDILPTHKLSTYIVLECHNGLAVDIASVTLGDNRLTVREILTVIRFESVL